MMQTWPNQTEYGALCAKWHNIRASRMLGSGCSSHFSQTLSWLQSKHAVSSRWTTRIYCVFAPAASPIGIIQYIWRSCFVSLRSAFYLSAARGWDAKHLLSIFLSWQLNTALLPGKCRLWSLLSLCRRWDSVWSQAPFGLGWNTRYLCRFLQRRALETRLTVMWAECPFLL